MRPDPRNRTREGPLSPVGSLRYYRDAIAEAACLPSDGAGDYLAHLRCQLAPHRASGVKRSGGDCCAAPGVRMPNCESVDPMVAARALLEEALEDSRADIEATYHRRGSTHIDFTLHMVRGL